MSPSRTDRRVATVLFIDIVGSTRIAAEVGNSGWRILLAAFRRAVRRQLKAYRGREQDTAGDGFFATFDQPAAAVRAAAAVVADAHRIGLNVRSGIHTGELDPIDRRRVGGIGAHIGARVTALAEPGQILVTSTVPNLVVGGGLRFAAAGEHELRGVPGSWQLFRVTNVDGAAVPEPLLGDEAAARRRTVVSTADRSASRLVIPAAIVLAVAAATLTVLVITGTSQPVALVKLDARTNEITAVVRDEHVSVEAIAAVWASGGTLWQTDHRALIRRDLQTGEFVASHELPDTTLNVLTTFGSVWVAHGLESTFIDRLDPISGRRLARIDPEGVLWDLVAGHDSLWGLTWEREVIEIDPLSNEVIDRDPTGTEADAFYLHFSDGRLLLCECGVGRITVFDPERDRPVSNVEYPQEGVGAVDPQTGLIWVLDQEASTATPYDPQSDSLGRSIGLSGQLGAPTFGYDAVWIPAGDTVHRVHARRFVVTSIPMPENVFAASVAIDEETGALWVSSCVCKEQH